MQWTNYQIKSYNLFVHFYYSAIAGFPLSIVNIVADTNQIKCIDIIRPYNRTLEVSVAGPHILSYLFKI